MITFLTETSHSLLPISVLLFYCFDKMPEKKDFILELGFQK